MMPPPCVRRLIGIISPPARATSTRDANGWTGADDERRPPVANLDVRAEHGERVVILAVRDQLEGAVGLRDRGGERGWGGCGVWGG